MVLGRGRAPACVAWWRWFAAIFSISRRRRRRAACTRPAEGHGRGRGLAEGQGRRKSRVVQGGVGERNYSIVLSRRAGLGRIARLAICLGEVGLFWGGCAAHLDCSERMALIQLQHNLHVGPLVRVGGCDGARGGARLDREVVAAAGGRRRHGLSLAEYRRGGMIGQRYTLRAG